MGDGGAFLDSVGVPRPDGTPLGDARHVLGVLSGRPDEHCLCMATVDVYGLGATTGLSLGDLRRLVALAELGHEFLQRVKQFNQV